MTPLFYEDSLGAKLVEKAKESVAAAEVARAERAGQPMPARGSDDLDLIDDPAALDAAEREVRGENPEDVYAEVGADWVPVFGPSKLSGIADVAGPNACIITMPLESAGIRYAWYPYPPEEMPGAAAPFTHAADRPFTLLVGSDDAEEARSLITACAGSPLVGGVPSTHELEPGAATTRRTLAWTLLFAFLGVDVFALFGYLAYVIYHFLRYGRF